eukprot:TRINITY_DN1930_c0_g1_i3.p1 TRINITY_DN1930_c0_g1~~TRINITY_DN1930_c0_g1_i3.p1  ORF type:complete len:348 (-),score=52.58 TRINITY_DN1930_c0_g1_i3:87-1130(-)
MFSEDKDKDKVEIKVQDALEGKIVGSILGALIGDVLGSSVEGWDIARIRKSYPDKLRDFIPGVPMGLHEVRYGHYTDDTNATLALASSLVENKGLVPKHAAQNYGKFWKSKPERGCPRSAQMVMQAILDGKDYKEAGTMLFKDGSFANGGVMRISPIGLAFRNASDEQIHAAVVSSLLSTHVHPQSVDAAFLQAKGISFLLKEENKGIPAREFLAKILEWSRNEEMKGQLKKLIILFENNCDDETFVREIGNQFQLKSIDAYPTVLWSFVHNMNDPEECIIHAVNLGGDTDTVASIAGSLCAAYNGCSWVPKRWWDNIENEARGRDYCVDIARELYALDLKDILPDE